jgi:hypothetical protein
MIAQLALELLGHIVQRRSHVGGLGVGSEGPAWNPHGGLDQLQPVRGAGVMLRNELELEAHQSRLQSLQASELLLRLRSDLIGHGEAPASELQLQRRSPLPIDVMALLIAGRDPRP